MRLQGRREHIGTLRMAASEVSRSGLSFAGSLDQEAAEVRHQRIDFIDLPAPPGGHGRIQRIGRRKPAEEHGRCEIHRQVHADAVRTEDAGNAIYSRKMLPVKYLWRCIHIIQHHAVDAQPGVQTAILRNAPCRQFLRGPSPDAVAGIAPFHRIVQVVPMVQDAPGIGRPAFQGNVGILPKTVASPVARQQREKQTTNQ